MMIFGLDEAGKGALIGPLCITVTGVSEKEKLSSDIKDSKLLTASQRKEIISRKIPLYLETRIVPTTLIDEYTYKKKLNVLLFTQYCRLLKKIPDYSVVYIDAFYNNITLKKQLEEAFKKIIFIVEYKADEKYRIVSLSSIYAKEEREKYLETKGLYKLAGSGYPSDFRTKEYIRNNYTLYRSRKLNEIRYSWKINL